MLSDLHPSFCDCSIPQAGCSASQPPFHAPFFSDWAPPTPTHPPPSASPLLWKARQMVRAKPSDVAVWLSRTLGHARWVCCEVFQVAPVPAGSSLSTLRSSATRQRYKTPTFIDRFSMLILFWFWFECSSTIHAFSASSLTLSLSFSPCLQCILGRIVEQAPG